jgi:hypothetical protein
MKFRFNAIEVAKIICALGGGSGIAAIIGALAAGMLALLAYLNQASSSPGAGSPATATSPAAAVSPPPPAVVTVNVNAPPCKP